MSKSKTGAAIFSEIHFVSSLPLEEAVRLIGAMASPEIAVTLTEINGEFWRFDMVRTLRHKPVQVGAKGILRRWQGTYTRVDCRSYVHQRFNWMLLASLILMLLSPLVLEPVFSAFLPVEIEANGVIYVFSDRAEVATTYAVLISLVWLPVLGWSIWRYRNRASDKDAGNELQRLIDAFKSVGDVSMDDRRLEDVEAESVPDTAEAARRSTGIEGRR